MNKFYIVRANEAGVFFGEVKERSHDEVTMTNVRKIWYWEGAAAVEQLAIDGVSKSKKCRFTVMVDEMIIANPIQIIPCTDKAYKSLSEVPTWKA